MMQVESKADLVHEISQFLFASALRRRSRYEEWEALWADEASTGFRNGDDIDPDRQMSIIYDNARASACVSGSS